MLLLREKTILVDVRFHKAGDFKEFRQRKANEKAICQRVFFAAPGWPQASPDVDYW